MKNISDSFNKLINLLKFTIVYGIHITYTNDCIGNMKPRLKEIYLKLEDKLLKIIYKKD